MNNNKELLALLVDMTKATRCCQQDSIFCEGVTFTQFYILDLVNQYENLHLSDLHKILSVEKSTSTRLIEPLVSRQLVTKERCCSDSRSIELTLTQKGKEIHKELWGCFDSFLNKLSAELPLDEKEDIFKKVMMFIKAVRKVFGNDSCCK